MGAEIQQRERRVFLGWERALLEVAVERLMGMGRRDGGAVDLGDLLVVVPTRQAGRRLREGLAVAASEGGGALLAPRVVVPEFLFDAEGDAVAGRAATLLAWVDVLQEVELPRVRSLFPVEPEERGFSWALGLAELMEGARSVLAEGGKTVADAEAVLPDAGRWRDFGLLEEKMVAKLAKRGLADRTGAQLGTAGERGLPDGVERVVVIGVPDMTGLAERALERLAVGGVGVEVWVYAPEALAGRFSAWGAALAEGWSEAVVEVPGFDERVRLAGDPAGQAEVVVDVLRRRSGERAVALGCVDEEVAGPLVRGLGDVGVKVFDPDGEARSRGELGGVLGALVPLLADKRWESFRELIRQPLVLDALARDFRGEFRRVRMLGGFDHLYDQRLCGTFGAVRSAVANPVDEHEERRRVVEMGYVVGVIGEQLGWFESMGLGGAVAKLLEWVDVDVEGGDRLLELVAEVEFYGGKWTPAEVFGLAVRLWSGERVYADGSDADLDLSGWLELLWEDAPELVVAGFNDGRVPDPVVGDAFLPEAGRELLGLRRNAERVGRDAYLFDAMLRWREAAGGAVHVVCGKVGLGGEPLKPSRLLLMCEDALLPERTRRLFGEAERGAGRSVPGWERTWLLKPPVLEPHGEVFEALRVTDFSSYLACPFRFYLKRGLKMEALDVEKEEMEARDFGTVVHVALEQLWNEAWARESSDVTALRGLMDEALEAAVRQRYGTRPPVPVVMQVEVAKERLRKAAEVHAGLVDEGWRTVEVERKFWEDEVDAWSVGGVNVRGTIDRIDVHEDGRVRVLDYKTSKKAAPPVEAHLAEVTKRTKVKWDDLEEWQRAEGGGKQWRWTNLQLPLYCLWAKERYAGAERLECGYFNLPMALGETGVSIWEDGASEWVLEAALRCAEGVAERVRGGVFWPPEERVKYDDFDGLAIGGTLAECLDGKAWKEAFQE